MVKILPAGMGAEVTGITVVQAFVQGLPPLCSLLPFSGQNLEMVT